MSRSMGCKSKSMMYKKGLWSPEEDEKLKNYISRYDHGCWSSLPTRAGLQRNGKSCRLRWINYLKPGLKRGVFTLQEEQIIISLHASLGNKWSQIAQQLPGRTDNEIKNYWHTCLKKKVVKAEGIQAESNMQYLSAAESTINFKESNSESTSLETIHSAGTTSENNMFVPKNLGADLIEGTVRKGLPKIIFSEWLPTDDAQQQNYTYPEMKRNQSSGKSRDPYSYDDSRIQNVASAQNDVHFEESCVDDLCNGGLVDFAAGVLCGDIDFDMYNRYLFVNSNLKLSQTQ